MRRMRRYLLGPAIAALAFAPLSARAASSSVYGYPAAGSFGLTNQIIYCPTATGTTTGTDFKCTPAQIAAYLFGLASGDVTMTSGGAATVGKIGGVSVAFGGAFTTTGTGAPTLAFPNTSQTYTFPAINDTLVTLTATQTLTNKSIAASEINSGQIALANGGTNANITASAGAVAYSSASALALTAAGSTGQCLTSNGTSAPSWGACGTGSAVTTTIGTGATLSGNSQIYVCTGTCSITLPTPAAGVQYCVMNDTAVTTVITVTPGGSNYVTNTSYAYKTVGTAIASSGAAGDQMCFLGRDTTHYLLGSYTGSWS